LAKLFFVPNVLFKKYEISSLMEKIKRGILSLRIFKGFRMKDYRQNYTNSAIVKLGISRVKRHEG